MPDETPQPPPEPPRPDERLEERPIPRGCHPFVFGVVMATLQLAVTIYFMRSC